MELDSYNEANGFVLIRRSISLCPLCHNRDKNQLYLSRCRDLLYGCSGEWELHKCSECQAVFLTPFPSDEEITSYYPQDYDVFNPPKCSRRNSLSGILRAIAVLPYRLRYGDPDWNVKPFGSGKLLDVGCGAGLFLRRAVELGWQCWGIDPNAYAIKVARQNSPEAAFVQGTLNQLDLHQAFDLITMKCVLEHLPSPLETLQLVKQLLVPRRKLFIKVPNISSLEAFLFRRL